jgi:hypothetical protein
MIDTNKLASALYAVQRSRKYLAHADTDEEQALVSLVEAQSILLEEMADVLMDIAREMND